MSHGEQHQLAKMAAIDFLLGNIDRARLTDIVGGCDWELPDTGMSFAYLIHSEIERHSTDEALRRELMRMLDVRE